MKVTIVAGARPNFMKIAPIIAEITKVQVQGANITYRLVHTGQHFDEAMSGQFFKDLNIPEPNINLNCSGGTQAEQTAQILVAFEQDLKNNPTDLVLVVGDVNSTMASCISAKKMQIPVAHIEAGIRSYDISMPEEINRIVTDSISDYFFTTSRVASENLIKIGKSKDQVFFVGNVMIDTLISMRQHFTAPSIYFSNNLKPKQYVVLTLHRPSNVDNSTDLENTIEIICHELIDKLVIFPMHPRTKMNYHAEEVPSNLRIVPPQGYLHFNYLIQNSLGVITDSGGITEETTIMNIPCISLRNSTERPETVEYGTNILVGKNTSKLKYYLNKMISGNWHHTTIPELWDGKTSKRIVKHLIETIATSTIP